MTNWRNSRDYRIWRAHVVRRDGVCQICGSRQKREAHHLNHSTYFIDERFDENNGITLCKKCHVHFHTTYKNSFREKCTKEDYSEYDKLSDYFFEIATIELFKKGLVNKTLINYNEHKKMDHKRYERWD